MSLRFISVFVTFFTFVLIPWPSEGSNPRCELIRQEIYRLSGSAGWGDLARIQQLNNEYYACLNERPTAPPPQAQPAPQQPSADRLREIEEQLRKEDAEIKKAVEEHYRKKFAAEKRRALEAKKNEALETRRKSTVARGKQKSELLGKDSGARKAALEQSHTKIMRDLRENSLLDQLNTQPVSGTARAPASPVSSARASGINPKRQVAAAAAGIPSRNTPAPGSVGTGTATSTATNPEAVPTKGGGAWLQRYARDQPVSPERLPSAGTKSAGRPELPPLPPEPPKPDIVDKFTGPANWMQKAARNTKRTLKKVFNPPPTASKPPSTRPPKVKTAGVPGCNFRYKSWMLIWHKRVCQTPEFGRNVALDEGLPEK